MAGFISNSQITTFTGAALTGFYTFRRGFVVNKEPLKTYTSVNENILPGYGPTSQVSNVSLTPVSGMFSGVILYGGENEYEQNTFTKTNVLYQGGARIKVLDDARRYIESGKTESLYFDETYWNIVGPCKVTNYLGLKFYYYPLNQVQ